MPAPPPSPAGPSRQDGDLALFAAGAPGPQPTAAPAPAPLATVLPPRDLRRAVLAWLAAQAPHGLALDVATRQADGRTDLAAFWSAPRRNAAEQGPRRLLAPARTLLVECRARRHDCWPDLADPAALLTEYRGLRDRRSDLERAIRGREPHLRADGGLFEEFGEWHYDRSRDPAYRALRRRLRHVYRSLYHGSRFEALRAAALADQLYLAVPAHTVDPHELPEGWGLLWVDAALRVTVARPATDQQPPAANRLHLVQQVASAAAASVLFSQGVEVSDGTPRFRPVPRRRRGRPVV